MNNIPAFLESVVAKNTYKVLKNVLNKIDFNLSTCEVKEIEKFILNTRPNSSKSIITICYALGAYAK